MLEKLQDVERRFDRLTAGCNECHLAAHHGFLVIQRPTAPPFTNQNFAPRYQPKTATMPGGKGGPFALDHRLAQGGLLPGKWRNRPNFARSWQQIRCSAATIAACQP